MVKKNYRRGDGTGFAGMSRITPKLRKMLMKDIGIYIPHKAWVNVNDFTLWESGYEGRGFDRITASTTKVAKTLEKYERS